jgi:hypothetical protein
VLDRDLEVAEAVLFEQGRLPQRRLDQGLRGRAAVLGEQPLVERAGVDADPQRHSGVGGSLGDLTDLVVELLDVARVHPDGRAAGVDRGEHVLRLEVDVGDDRDLALLRDDVQHVGVVLAGDGHPHDVAAGGGELAICCSVPLMSVVLVVVIDCTEIGAPPPTGTLPTLIRRVGLRGASTGAGAAGIPRLMAGMTLLRRSSPD